MKLIILSLLVIPNILLSQINESDSVNVNASLSITGFWQGGNVETKIFRARGDFSARTIKNWVFKTKNSYVYQEFGLQKADEDVLSLNYLYFNPQKRFYPLLLGFVSTNFRRQIDLRSLFGFGFTYQILDQKENWLKFSLSSEYEQTRFNNSSFNISNYNGTNEINTFRGTLWVKGRYQLIADKMILTHESFFQYSLEQSDNYRWQADIGLEIPIIEYFNFKINYLHTFESIVIQGQKEEDKFLTFGFTLRM